VDDVANPFATAEMARQYHSGRPYHHKRTLSRALELAPVDRGPALDVACGTGLSTLALAELGFDASGIDGAEVMLAIARATTGLPFVVAAAERLPRASASSELVTVGSGVHWFDQAAFFEEAVRVLRPGGVLVLYDHTGVHLSDDESFAVWWRSEFAARFPTPPRGPVAGLADAAPHGLETTVQERWIDSIAFTHDDLVRYLLTQSNVAHVLTDPEGRRAAEEWVAQETSRYFGADATRPFSFHVIVQCLRRDPA
jgi:SAM-dependent methyltransferase